MLNNNIKLQRKSAGGSGKNQTSNGRHHPHLLPTQHSNQRGNDMTFKLDPNAEEIYLSEMQP